MDWEREDGIESSNGGTFGRLCDYPIVLQGQYVSKHLPDSIKSMNGFPFSSCSVLICEY